MNAVAKRITLDLGYIPLPDRITNIAVAKLLDVQCAGGQPLRQGVVRLQGSGASTIGSVIEAWMFAYMEAFDRVAMHAVRRELDHGKYIVGL